MRAVVSSLVLFLSTSLLFAVSPDSNYGKIPLNFEKNQGQFHNGIDFVSRGAGHIFKIRPSQFELTFKDKGGMRATLFHANNAAPAEGSGPAGKVNYLIGANPSQWRTDIPPMNKSGTSRFIVYRHDVLRQCIGL
jgi:hypothetical protein